MAFKSSATLKLLATYFIFLEELTRCYKAACKLCTDSAEVSAWTRTASNLVTHLKKKHTAAQGLQELKAAEKTIPKL